MEPLVVPLRFLTVAAGYTEASAPGPRTPEGLERSRRANWKHGMRSADAVRQRKSAVAVRHHIKELPTQVYHFLAKTSLNVFPADHDIYTSEPKYVDHRRKYGAGGVWLGDIKLE